MADLTTQLASFLKDLYAGNLGVTLPITTLQLQNGTAAAPSLTFANNTNRGLFNDTVNGIVGASYGGSASWGWNSSTIYLGPGTAHGIQAGSGSSFGWTSGDAISASVDTQLLRASAGNVSLGSNLAAAFNIGTAGIIDQGTHTITAGGATAFQTAGANGQSRNVQQLSELTTIAAAATTDTTIQMPAASVVLAVTVRVVTVIPTAATFTVGDSGNATRFSTAAVSSAAGSTDPGTKAGAYYNASALSVRFTPNAQPAAATGQVRVTIFYYTVTPPTS